MIQVRLLKAGERITENIKNGAYAVPSEDGNWLYVYDDGGLTLGVYPKDAVISARTMEGGETTMTGENTE